MRYVDSYAIYGAMQPISEEEAKQRGTYSVEITEDGQRHFQDVLDHALERVIYPEASPSSDLVEQHCRKYRGIPFWVVSPITHLEHGPNYTIWYYIGDGTFENRVEYENWPMLNRETWFHPDGSLGGTTDRRFNEAGEQIEVIYRDPDGRISVIDD